MKQFEHIIFDLDGTLTDSRQGIGNSISYALQKLNIEGFDGVVPDSFIGPPLQQCFREVFHLNDRNTELAVEYFREYYSAKGLYENHPYPGILEMLEQLYTIGKHLYIATSKLEHYAIKIAEHFGFDKYITQIKGADYKGEYASKTTIISTVLNMQKLTPGKNIAMVGDTVFDIVGGNQNGLSTIAVMYGFGKPEDLQSAGPDYCAETVDDLYEILDR